MVAERSDSAVTACPPARRRGGGGALQARRTARGGLLRAGDGNASNCSPREASFPGEVIGLIGSGLFVRFGEVFEGFLPVRRLGRDWYDLNELATALVGRGSGFRYRLGDRIPVAVERIEAERGRVALRHADVPGAG